MDLESRRHRRRGRDARRSASSWSKSASRGRLVLNQPAGHLERPGNPAGRRRFARPARKPRGDFTPQALVGTYLWRNPDNGRGFLRFAFCGEVDDHRPQQPLDTGIVRALWLSHAELQAQVARLRSPLVMRCIEDFLQRPAPAARFGGLPRPGIGAARPVGGQSLARRTRARQRTIRAVRTNSRRNESSSACPAEWTPPSPRCCSSARASKCTGST